MGFRFGLQIILCLTIPSLAFAQPVHVFSTVATRLRGAATLPSTCAAGEIYRDSDATTGQQIYLCESTNTWVLQGDGGGASGWTDDGTELRLTTSTDEVEIGSAATLSAKFAVNGDADEIQALIQGNATQTNDILVIENSAGTDILTGANGGIKVTGGLAATNLVSCDTIDTDASGIMYCGADSGAASGAPTDADYLVGTASSSLSAEIVVGTTPGGELGNTWASPTLDDSVTVTGWVMGDSTATTPSADDNDTSLATTAYVQTELSNGVVKSFNLPIYSAKLTGAFVVFTPPTADACTQGAQIDAGDGNWRLLFDATTDECATWQFIMPSNYASAPLLDVMFSMASGEANEVEFEAAVMCYTPTTDTANIGTASFSNVAVGTATTVSATAGEAYLQTITLTDDTCAAGDIVFVVLSTDANDATNDDATGDREVVGVNLRYTGL